jgi:hypothetical protein
MTAIEIIMLINNGLFEAYWDHYDYLKWIYFDFLLPQEDDVEVVMVDSSTLDLLRDGRPKMVC